MKPTEKQVAAAHLWLYEAGVDPDDKDIRGANLVESLATMMARAERDGRLEAAAHYLRAHGSGEFTASITTTAKPAAPGEETTGVYDTRQLEELLAAAKSG